MMTPRAVRQYRWFCLAMVVLNLGLGVLALGFPELASRQDWGFDPGFVLSLSRGVFWLGLALAAGNGLFLILPRTAWAYTLHLTNLSMAVASCIWSPLAGPLLVAYSRADVKRYYGLG